MLKAAELLRNEIMTRKKAIKTIMSVTGHGDKRAANKALTM